MMVQVAAKFGLDFTTANLRSRDWWLKLRWIVDRTEDLNTEKVFSMQHAQHVSVLDYNLEKQAFEEHWNSANKLMASTYNMHFPWLKDAKDTSRQTANEQLMAQWRAKYGDPSDPKVRAKFKEVADAMKRKRSARPEMFAEQKQLQQTMKKLVAGRRSKKAKKDK